MIYGSVCSGIEAATVAWHSLGWRSAWLAEIEPFPSAVLAHHYPNVPNLGDMTKIARAVLSGDAEAPDVLVGGTPCQAFSVAGLREGLSDERGQLTIKYVELIDAIDFIRRRRDEHPAIVVWENVPGVLSSKDNAFGCFLGALAGEDDELQPPGKKWANAGCVFGPARTIAWRIIDAQYTGVAQRRRRVFVIASARKDFDPVKVLFEFDGVRRDTAPRREAGQEAAGTLASRTGAGGFPGTDEACSGYLQAYGGGRTSGRLDVAACLTAKSKRIEIEVETLALIKPIAFDCKASGQSGFGVGEIASTMRSMGHLKSHQNGGGHLAVCVTGEVTHTLTAGFDASEDGTGRGQPIVPAYSVALRGREGGATAELGDDIAGCLRASIGGGDKPHVLAAFDMQQITSPHNRAGVIDGEPAPTMAKASRMHAVAGMAVRRLTPRECERLQGFPDDYTSIPTWNGWRKMDASETPESCRAEGLEIKQNKKTGKWRVKDVDGPRYKALGNSMAVPVMRWIGKRIDGFGSGMTG
ncbi:MAG: DNA cytosine methyltransferase [Paraburkholderia fungorum]|nr:DNA cytosine methyltransferase [Paraburkholderia fungorum]